MLVVAYADVEVERDFSCSVSGRDMADVEEVRGAWCVNRPSKSVDQLIQLADKFSGSTDIISGGMFTVFRSLFSDDHCNDRSSSYRRC